MPRYIRINIAVTAKVGDEHDGNVGYSEIDEEYRQELRKRTQIIAMPGKDSDKGRISEENGTPDVQLATGNEGNVDQPCDGKSTENDKEESSNIREDQIDDLCETNVDDVVVHQHSVEIEGRSLDLEGHVPDNGDNLTDTDSDSDIFAIKSAPEGASQVTEITEDKGLPSQDEPHIPYTVESLFPVEDDVNEEPGNLKGVNIAVSVYREDESVDGATEESDMDVDVNKVSDIEDDLKNDDKGSDLSFEDHNVCALKDPLLGLLRRCLIKRDRWKKVGGFVSVQKRIAGNEDGGRIVQQNEENASSDSDSDHVGSDFDERLFFPPRELLEENNEEGSDGDDEDNEWEGYYKEGAHGLLEENASSDSDSDHVGSDFDERLFFPPRELLEENNEEGSDGDDEDNEWEGYYKETELEKDYLYLSPSCVTTRSMTRKVAAEYRETERTKNLEDLFTEEEVSHDSMQEESSQETPREEE
ncbi:uncharacterized protein [Palaemon carinicauda]|uniref:uncharacterized protein n=1 Tax=Palaemon carinicauda TaxID=392227 RepID=UPI0035B60125